MEKLLTTSVAANAFGVSPRSLARWCRQGLIVPDQVTPDGHCRWTVAGLYRQLDALRAKDARDG